MQPRPTLVVALAVLATVGLGVGIVGSRHDRPRASEPAPTAAVRGVRHVAAEELPAAAAISVRAIPGLGRVLVDADGRTLYAFLPDARKHVTCLRACTAYWRPVLLAPGQQAPLVGHGARASLAGGLRGAGGRVATYAGWPLYTFTNDLHTGLARGQRALLPEPCAFLNLDCSRDYGGAVSLTLTPAGALNRRTPAREALGP